MAITIQSDHTYPVLFYLDPSPSRRKSLVTDLQHNYVMHTYSMCVRLSGSLTYPDIFAENGCGSARSGCSISLSSLPLGAK